MKKGNEPVEIIPKLLLLRGRHLEIYIVIWANFHLLFLLTMRGLLVSQYSCRLQEQNVTQSCPTHSDPMACSPPGSSVPGIFHARVLEWGAIAFSGSQLQHVNSWLWHVGSSSLIMD